MEFLVISVLFVIALSMLVYKTIHLVMFFAYPLPGEEIKWRRSPTLPMRDLSQKFGAKSKKKKSTKEQQTQPKETELLAQAEIPLESVIIAGQRSVSPPPLTQRSVTPTLPPVPKSPPPESPTPSNGARGVTVNSNSTSTDV